MTPEEEAAAAKAAAEAKEAAALLAKRKAEAEAAAKAATGPTMADLAALESAVNERLDEVLGARERGAAKAGPSGVVIALATLLVLAALGAGLAIVRRMRGAA